MTGTIMDVAQNHQIIEVSISQVEVFSIISSVISIVLGIVAIVLSITFYKMSEKSAKESETSSKNIEASVRKLETLFDKLYSGTFDMMRETVSDMRKHAYSNGKVTVDDEDISREIEEKTSSAVAKVVEEIKSSQKGADEIEQLILTVINKSKEFEKKVKTGALREAILGYLKNNGVVTFRNLRSAFMEAGLVTRRDPSLYRELLSLTDEGIIDLPLTNEPDGEQSISFDAMIRLK